MQTGILVPHTAASNRPTRIDNSMQPRPCPFIGKRPHPGTRAAPLQNVLSTFLPLIQPSDAACPKIHPPGSVVQKSYISISTGRYIFLAHYPPIDQNFFQNLLAQTIGLLYITPCAETRTLNGRLAQGESASLTRKRSQVQILYRPPTVIRPLDFQWPVFYQYPHPRSASRRYRTRQTNVYQKAGAAQIDRSPHA